LKEATEELTSSRVDEILGVLDELKIAGVRPKFRYKDQLLLSADLKLNERPEFKQNPREFGAAIDRLQNELDQKGFNLAGSEKKLELVSKYGELTVGTDKGVEYTLHIGNPVEGDETEIEIGSGSSGDAKATEDGSAKEKKDSDDAEAGQDDPAKPGDEKADEDDEVDNRYLLVRVALDQSLINPKPEPPVKPVEPVAPEGYQPAPEKSEKKESDAKAPEDVQAPEDVEAPEGEKASDDKPTGEERDPAFVKHDQAVKAFEDAKVQYELDSTRFEEETKAFAEKIAEAQKLVDELNERFGSWYYVMSADNLNILRTQRTDLVTVKEPEPSAEPAATEARPNISFPDLPAGVVPGESKKVPMEQAGEADEPAEDSSLKEAKSEGEAEGGEAEGKQAEETIEGKPEAAKPAEAVDSKPKATEKVEPETPKADGVSDEANPEAVEAEKDSPVESVEKKE